MSMKTNNFRSIAIHCVAVILLSITTMWILNFSLNFFLEKFSSVTYNDNMSFKGVRINYLLCIIYGIAAYNLDIITLNEIKKQNWKNLLFQVFLDVLIIPLSVFIMVVYNNQTLKSIGNFDSLTNIYLVIILLSIKHVIFLIIYKRFIVKKKNN